MTAAVNTAPTAVAMNAFCTDPVGWLSAAPAASLQAAQQFRFDLGLPQLLLLSKSAAVDAGMDASLNFDRFASWTMLFLALYLLFALLWKLVPGSGLQKGSLPFVASSRCIGTVHCVLVVPLGCLALIQQSPDWRLLEYLGPNTALEQRVVELSVGYFVADFVHFILFEPDFLMFFHHVFRSGKQTRECGENSIIAFDQPLTTPPFFPYLLLWRCVFAVQHPDDEFRWTGRSWFHMRHGRLGARRSDQPLPERLDHRAHGQMDQHFALVEPVVHSGVRPRARALGPALDAGVHQPQLAVGSQCIGATGMDRVQLEWDECPDGGGWMDLECRAS
jgi:hypothetical protein